MPHQHKDVLLLYESDQFDNMQELPTGKQKSTCRVTDAFGGEGEI